MVVVIYAVYMYIVWKINTGQGDAMKNATYWRRWYYLKGREVMHMVAYKADLKNMAYKDKYEILTQKAYLGG